MAIRYSEGVVGRTTCFPETSFPPLCFHLVDRIVWIEAGPGSAVNDTPSIPATDAISVFGDGRWLPMRIEPDLYPSDGPLALEKTEGSPALEKKKTGVVSMDSTQLERGSLEGKDRDELTTIATALGGKPASRARKAEIVDLILDLASGGNGSAVFNGAGSRADDAGA
ncbi:uncharacterized protein METZ01_LOCUS473150, partial [marine metagenome]